MRHRILPLALSLTISMAATGCDPLNIEQAARILGAKLDENTTRIVTAFLSAVKVAERESNEWKHIADQARRDFESFQEDLGVEAMAFVDFLADRVREGAGQVEQITAMLKRQEYGEAASAFQELQAAVRKKYGPKVAAPSPKQIDMVWVDHGRFRPVDPGRSTIFFFGYNFDPAMKEKYGVETRNKQGAVLRTAQDHHLTIASPYIAVLDVSEGSGMGYRKDETLIALTFEGRQIASVVVAWGNAEPANIYPEPNKWYYLRWKISGQDLAVRGEPRDNADIVQNPRDPKNVWRLVPSTTHPGYFHIEFRTDKPWRYLDVYLRNRQDGGRICLAAFDADQVWRLCASNHPAEQGFFRLQTAIGDHFYLDVFQGSNRAGGRICQCPGSNLGQVLRFEPAE
jgi:hypothetical protein